MIILTILFALSTVILGCFYFKSRKTWSQKLDIKQSNKELWDINSSLSQEKIEKEKALQNLSIEYESLLETSSQAEDDLERTKEEVKEKRDLVNSLSETARKLREDAEVQAEQVHNSRMRELQISFAAKSNELDRDYKEKSDALDKQILIEEQKLQDLQAKQTAYMEALKRQEEMDANQDYYRLVVDELDLNDIELLRNVQKGFSKKESIDKLIWELYYKSAYDALVSRIFGSKTKISGIYKITNLLTGLSYIGQSVDIRERWRQHIKTSLAYSKSSNKLYQTMQKSGQHNFTFEVLEEVPRDKLNERETYWIDFYKTKEYGLNSTKGGS